MFQGEKGMLPLVMRCDLFKSMLQKGFISAGQDRRTRHSRKEKKKNARQTGEQRGLRVRRGLKRWVTGMEQAFHVLKPTVV